MEVFWGCLIRWLVGQRGGRVERRDKGDNGIV